ncbi:MAG: hypothetical protein PVJ02_08160 [Gemmatimonadota bacterium]|jgi:hypothetical protein
MDQTIRRASYFYTTVNDRPGEALRFLTSLADLGINLLAFTAIPVGLHQTQLTIFPDDAHKLTDQSERAGFSLDGPYSALFVQGRDVPGALVAIHEALHDAHVNVYAATGVSGGAGQFGYMLHVRPGEFETAAAALGV